MFTGAHLHLLVNHAPIFGSVFAFALLVCSYFAARDVLRRAAFVVPLLTAVGSHSTRVPVAGQVAISIAIPAGG